MLPLNEVRNQPGSTKRELPGAAIWHGGVSTQACGFAASKLNTYTHVVFECDIVCRLYKLCDMFIIGFFVRLSLHRSCWDSAVHVDFDKVQDHYVMPPSWLPSSNPAMPRAGPMVFPLCLYTNAI